MSERDDESDISELPNVVKLDSQLVVRFLESYPDLPLQVVIGAVRNAQTALPTPRPDRHSLLIRLITSTLDGYNAR